MAEDLDREVVALGARLSELGRDTRSKVFRMSWWSERMLDWAMERPDFKTQLFRFVDVFPALKDDADTVRHLHEYFDGPGVPRAFDLGIDAADHLPFGRTVSARVAARNIERMASQFILGTNAAEAADGVRELWQAGRAAT